MYNRLRIQAILQKEAMEIDRHIYRIKQALKEEECNTIINNFENSDQKEFGPKNEHCTKNNIHFYEYINQDARNCIFTKALIKGLIEYKEKYTFLKTKHWGVTNRCKIQKYLPGDSYFVEHCEHENTASFIMLAWMFYLNDVINDGGGTYFPQQKLILTPKTGDLIIWPAFWTHSHKGLASERTTKYIVTGWCYYFSDEEVEARTR